MRGVLVLACRAFPPDHRARRSEEVVDTALLAADGSAWRTVREALSLVGAGLRERLHATKEDPSILDGVALLAGVLAIVNLAVALYGISLAVVSQPFPAISLPFGVSFPNPYVVDWWWIAFAFAAAATVLGLVLGNRTLAVGAALANVGVVGYDALFLADHDRGHMNAFAFLRGPDGYPVGKEWLAPAIVLALATAVAPLRRRSLLLVPLALVAAVLVVVLGRHDAGGFIFLRWPFGVVVIAGVVLGWLFPRLAVVAVGVSLALAPSVYEYLTGPSWEYRAPAVTWIAAPGLALGIVLPLAYLTRRRVT